MSKELKFKTLGISIPTYKRPDYLKKCILSAIEDAGNIPVKIFIVDDSLSDVNKRVIDELTAKWDFIFYKSNAVNMGIDDNIQEAIDFCACDYSWVIGEDDIFLPGSIKRIYDFIQPNDYDFIYSNYQFANEDHSVFLHPAIADVEEGRMQTTDFIEKYLWTIGFIGACVIKKEAWDRTSPAAYKGTYYTHVGRIVNIIAKHHSIYISRQPNVANRAQGADTFTWKKDSFGVFTGFEKMCRIAGNNDKSIQIPMLKAAKGYRNKIGYLSVKTLLRLRAESSYDYDQFKKYIAHLDTSSIKRACFYLISIVPSYFLKPLVYLHGKMNK